MPSADSSPLLPPHCRRSSCIRTARCEVSLGIAYLLHKAMPDLQPCTSVRTRAILSDTRLPSHSCLIQFLCVIALFYHRLPSDSSSRRTPLPRLVDRFDSAYSGLPPPRYTLRQAHIINDSACASSSGIFFRASVKYSAGVKRFILYASTAAMCESPLYETLAI